MLKKSFITLVLVFAVCCHVFAAGWDGIEYTVQTKDIVFQIENDVVIFSSESGVSEFDILSVVDEDDYYKIQMESDRFIMMSKEFDRGKVAIGNTLYMFHGE